MAEPINITITNLPEIRLAFSRAPYLMTLKLNEAIRMAVIGIQGDSMRNTPVLTGRLRASTYSRFTNLAGEVGTNTNYDVYVHEGTRYMKARPYLRDAVDSNKDETNRRFRDAVQSVLNQIGDMT